MKTNIISSELQRAAVRQVERQSFIARNYWLWVVIAYIVYPIAAGWSALTAGGNIFLRLKIAAGDSWWVAGIAFSLAVMIEVLKYYTGKTAIDDWQASAWTNGGAERVGMLVKGIGFVAIMAFSINLSLSGAQLANEYFRERFKPVETEAAYVDVNGINARFDAQLEQHYKNISDYKKIQWRGVVTVPAQRMIAREQRAIDKILAERESEVSRANSRNDATEAEHEAETLTNGNFLRGLAGVGEIIVIFCLIFIGIYDDGLRAEYERKGGKPVQNAGIGFRPATTPEAFSFNREQNVSSGGPVAQDFDLTRYMRTIEARLEQLANKPGNTIGEQEEQTGEQAREQANKVCSPVRTNSVKKPGKPHSMRGTNSREQKNLRRSIAMYKQRLVEGTLTEKGAATLARMEAQLHLMKA